MKHLLFVALVTLFQLVPSYINAQDKWEDLPNIGLVNRTKVRFEDIYFTDYKTGCAVNLAGDIYKTKDGGSNWYLIPMDTSERRALRCIEFLSDKKTGICGGFSGMIYRTTDAGETWSDISAAVTDTSILLSKAICGLSHVNNTFYGVGWYGARVAHFYKSTDKGEHWETIYIDTALARGLVDVVFVSEDTGFACGFKGIDYTYGHSVVIKTTDGGKSWSTVYDGGKDNGIVWKLQFVNRDFAVGSIQFTGATGLDGAFIKSTDGGNNWVKVVTNGKPDLDDQGIGFISPLKGWMGGYYQYMYETTDGGLTWDTVKTGQNFNRFFVMDSSHIYAAGKSIHRYGSDFTVGIKKQEARALVPHILYPVSPNPAKEKIKIEFELGTHTMTVLQVFNIDAKRMWEVSRAVLTPGRYTYYWDSKDAPPGQYFIRLDNNEMAITQQFTLIR